MFNPATMHFNLDGKVSRFLESYYGRNEIFDRSAVADNWPSSIISAISVDLEIPQSGTSRPAARALVRDSFPHGCLSLGASSWSRIGWSFDETLYATPHCSNRDKSTASIQRSTYYRPLSLSRSSHGSNQHTPRYLDWESGNASIVRFRPWLLLHRLSGLHFRWAMQDRCTILSLPHAKFRSFTIL